MKLNLVKFGYKTTTIRSFSYPHQTRLTFLPIAWMVRSEQASFVIVIRF